MNQRAWAAFAAMSVIWGLPYLFIKVAVDDGVSPAFLSFARVLLAAVVLLGTGSGSPPMRWPRSRCRSR